MSELVNGFDASIVDEKASKVGPAAIDIAYQRLGNPDAPLVLLIMGIAAQSIAWPDEFCHALIDRGLQIVRFDNRDVGLSTHLTDVTAPDLPAVLAGDLSSVSYTLSDMAADAVGLLDALGFEKAHVVGASMGGAIAQTMAIEHPDRVRSLTSMMSTTGNMSVGQASPDDPPRIVRRLSRRHPRGSCSTMPCGPSAPSDRQDIRAMRMKSPPEQAALMTVATIPSASRGRRLQRSHPEIGPSTCDISGYPPL